MQTKTKVSVKEVASKNRSTFRSTTGPFVEPNVAKDDTSADEGSVFAPLTDAPVAPKDDVPVSKGERRSQLKARGPPVEERYIGSLQLRQRYGNVSHMWIERRLRLDPDFPKPIKIGRLRFWLVSELENYERSKVVG